MAWWIVLTGLLVGTGIGLTGMGGALVMTPLLILLFGFSPTQAVGTDLIFASITKLAGSIQHSLQKSVHFKLVLYLSMGSIPGGLIGVYSLHAFDRLFVVDVDVILGYTLSILFIVMSLFMVYSMVCRRSAEESTEKTLGQKKAIVLGALGGCLVGLTSVGSGSLFVPILMILTSMSAAKLVGTDIVHAFLLTLVTGLVHASFGHVHWEVVLYLICGSIPGIIIGSRLTVKIPDWLIRSLLIIILSLTGLRMFMS